MERLLKEMVCEQTGLKNSKKWKMYFQKDDEMVCACATHGRQQNTKIRYAIGTIANKGKTTTELARCNLNAIGTHLG